MKPGELEPKPPKTQQVLLPLGLSLLLAVTVFGMFSGALRADFLTYDDPDYVVNNPEVQKGLTWEGLRWALTTSHSNNWHPLTWLSHMLDCQIYGMRAWGHHLTNVLIHMCNTVLVFLVLWQITGAMWRSLFVAALFGLHPMHVESVAWVAERKDVLSTFFFLMTLAAYGTYAKDKGKGQKPKAWLWYGVALVLFALGLMSKPMLVTLPFVLLLLDIWPLRRFFLFSDGTQASGAPSKLWRIIAEKVPFFALAGIASAITLRVQSQEGNVATVQALPLELRIGNAAIGYVRYLGKLFWPTRLAAHYPYNHHPSVEQALLAGLVLLLLSAAVVWISRSRPYVLVGWLFFLGTMVPVIGLIQVGTQSMANRYSYIPYIGLFVIISWGLADFANQHATRLRLGLAASGAIVALGLCCAVTLRQVVLWQTTEKLFTYSLAVAPGDANAHANLGAALAMKSKYDEAAVHYQEALALWPEYPEAKSNMAFIFIMKGKHDEAIALCRAALRLRPSLAPTHYLLAMALLAKGERPESVTEYRTSLALNPNQPLACNDLAWILATDPNANLRNGAEAVSIAERACRLTDHKEPQFIGTLAAAYAEAGRFDEAVKSAERAKSVAEKTAQPELARKNEELLKLYRAHQPYRETPNR